MKHTILLPIFGSLVFLFAGCATLPKEVPNGGVAVMLLYFDNESSQTSPIRKYDFQLSDGSFVRLVPRAGFLAIPLRSPDLKIVSYRVSLNLDGWSGGEQDYAVDIPLPVVPGKITYLPWAFRYAQSNSEKEGYYKANGRLVPMNVMMTSDLEALVAKDPNYKYWSQ